MLLLRHIRTLYSLPELWKWILNDFLEDSTCCVAFPTPFIGDFPLTANTRATEMYSSRQYSEIETFSISEPELTGTACIKVYCVLFTLVPLLLLQHLKVLTFISKAMPDGNTNTIFGIIAIISETMSNLRLLHSGNYYQLLLFRTFLILFFFNQWGVQRPWLQKSIGDSRVHIMSMKFDGSSQINYHFSEEFLKAVDTVWYRWRAEE